MDIYAHGDTVYHIWNTRGGDGEPITMAGTPTVAVYKDGSTTPMTLDVPASLSIDRGGAAVIGCHLLTLVLSDADFVAGFYEVRLTAGTVDGVSFVGVVCLEFRIGAVISDAVAAAEAAQAAAEAAQSAAESADTAAGLAQTAAEGAGTAAGLAQTAAEAAQAAAEGIDPPTEVEIAAEIMAAEPADYYDIAGSVGRLLYELRQRSVGEKIVMDRAAGTLKFYKGDGSTLIATFTMETVGDVDTLTRS